MRNILLVSATKLEHHDDEINGYPIHIIGVGKVAAATNTLKLINQYKPEAVINFGSCGNLKGYDVGQILEIGEVYDDFYGCVVPEHEPISVLLEEEHHSISYLLQIPFMIKMPYTVITTLI